MATTVIPPGFAQVAIETRHQSYIRPAVNVFGIAMPSGSGAARPALVKVADAWFANMLARFDNETRFYSARIAVGQDGGPPVTAEVFPDTAGARAISSLPPAMALRVRFGTSLGGRRGRGSMFLCWALAEGTVNEVGNINPAEVTGWEAVINSFRDELEAEDVPMHLLHSTGLTEPPPPTPIEVSGVDPVISNQVRRQLRR